MVCCARGLCLVRKFHVVYYVPGELGRIHHSHSLRPRSPVFIMFLILIKVVLRALSYGQWRISLQPQASGPP